MSKKINKSYAENFSDFNAFHAIKNILESGVIYSADGKDFAERVIELCDEAIRILFMNFEGMGEGENK